MPRRASGLRRGRRGEPLPPVVPLARGDAGILRRVGRRDGARINVAEGMTQLMTRHKRVFLAVAEPFRVNKFSAQAQLASN